jgi:hypothetical protein
VFGVRKPASHARLDGRGTRAFKTVILVILRTMSCAVAVLKSPSRINPFYAAHQLFRLAGARFSRYSSVFQVNALKPAISTSLCP